MIRHIDIGVAQISYLYLDKRTCAIDSIIITPLCDCNNNQLHMLKIFLHILITSILLMSCSGHPDNVMVDYSALYREYGSTHFIGIGSGEGKTQQDAIKIAKTRALGDLAENINVSIVSKVETIISEAIEGNDVHYNEQLKQNIISIGKATVRSPEIEILATSKNRTGFKAVVLTKKSISAHIEETARSLGSMDAGNLILEYLNEQPEATRRITFD